MAGSIDQGGPGLAQHVERHRRLLRNNNPSHRKRKPKQLDARSSICARCSLRHRQMAYLRVRCESERLVDCLRRFAAMIQNLKVDSGAWGRNTRHPLRKISRRNGSRTICAALLRGTITRRYTERNIRLNQMLWRRRDINDSVVAGSVTVEQILQAKNTFFQSQALQRKRKRLIEEDRESRRLREDQRWTVSDREICPKCGAQQCRYIRIASATSHKNETWGTADLVSSTKWHCDSCSHAWSEEG